MKGKLSYKLIEPYYVYKYNILMQEFSVKIDIIEIDMFQINITIYYCVLHVSNKFSECPNTKQLELEVHVEKGFLANPITFIFKPLWSEILYFI